MSNARKPTRKSTTGAPSAPARPAKRKRAAAAAGAAAGPLPADAAMREQLVALLRGGGAHATFDAVVADLPAQLRGRRPAGSPFTPWMLLEHMRIAQWDILEFSRDPRHESPEFPSGYWPADPAPATSAAWDASIARFRSDRDALERLVVDPACDLFARFPHGTGQNLLREVLVAASHTSYHLGELVLVRRLLGAWTG